jgi:uncharacterized membrane protein YoaK (UPF0700 family)
MGTLCRWRERHATSLCGSVETGQSLRFRSFLATRMHDPCAIVIRLRCRSVSEDSACLPRSEAFEHERVRGSKPKALICRIVTPSDLLIITGKLRGNNSAMRSREFRGCIRGADGSGSMDATHHLERYQSSGDTIVQLFRTRASGLIASMMRTKNELALERPPQHAFDWLFVTVLSMTAGAVDVIGFLALGGLFTAHITGNIVILAAHYITGGFSRIGPLIAVPVFITVLGIVIWVSKDKQKHRTLRALLILQAVLLIGFLALSAVLGPFTNPGSAVAAAVGMLGVAAMATQNALVKLDLPGFPTTAVLTTDTVQLTIDLTTLVRGKTLPEEMALARHRIRMTFPAFAGFIVGCATGALLEVHFGLWALTFPVLLAVVAIPLSEYTVQTVMATRTQFACAVSAADTKASVDTFVQ